MIITLANVGLPMLPVQGFVMIIALIPIILIEGAIAHWKLLLTWARSFVGSFLSNLVSTIVGVPLSWGIMFALQMFARPHMSTHNPPGILVSVILGSARIGPAEDQVKWMVPLALIVLLIPSFFISVVIEYLVNRRVWRECERHQIWNTARLANGVTYGIMIAILYALAFHGMK